MHGALKCSFHTLIGNSDARVRGMVKESTRIREKIKHIDDLNLQISTLQQKTKDNFSLHQCIHEKIRAEWTYHSNAIEGSALTLSDTIFFLREGLTVQGKSLKDFLDAQNHAEALVYLYTVQKEHQPIDTSLIKQINFLLLRGVEIIPTTDHSGNKVMRKIHPGCYKKHPNYVLTLSKEMNEYVDPSDVEYQMDNLFSWINEKIDRKCIHPLIISAMAHYNMVRIHPFDDGNGRSARILMNFILMRSEQQVAVIRNEDRHQYFKLLNEADKSGELDQFTEFVGDSLIKTQEMIFEQLNK